MINLLPNKILKRSFNFLLFLSSFFTIHYSLFIAICSSQWVQQNLPITGTINDMVFFDANTGIIAMNTTPPYILRTTNGGNNWTIGMSIRVFFMSKADSTTVYGNGDNQVYDLIYRSFDRGLTWDSVALSASITYCSVAFVDKDTGWVSGYDGNINRMYKTTNGGINIFSISTQTGYGILSFLKQKYNNEYCGWNLTSGFLLKTTNSGVNWVNIPNPLGGGNFNSIFFLNKDIGWCYIVNNPSRIMYTSNGGSNWITQFIDSTNNAAADIYFNNLNKGWGGRAFYKIWATSDGGNNWGTQNVPIINAGQLSIIDSLLGWSSGYGLAKTINGGGIITYIGNDSNNTSIPLSFILLQNYPNPFNPSTTIKFSINNDANVNLLIYDVTGKEILNIYKNKFLTKGNYKATIDFNPLNLPGGIYFYSLQIYDEKKNQTFIENKKMV